MTRILTIILVLIGTIAYGQSVGYETSSSSPEFLKIDFHPKGEYMSGPRFTVEMNILTEQAIKVYMTPDA